MRKSFANQSEGVDQAQQQQQQQKSGTSWARIKALFREHGVSFAVVYTTAYAATWLPLFASLEMGGVDGPELLVHAVEYVGLADRVNISWITENRYLNRDVINALIAMEINGLLDIFRLPIVIGVVPYVSAKLKTMKKQALTVSSDTSQGEKDRHPGAS